MSDTEKQEGTGARRARPLLTIYIAALTITGISLAATVASRFPLPASIPWMTAGVVLVLLVAAEFQQIKVRYRGGTLTLSMNEAVLAPALLILPAALLAPLVAAGILIEGSIRRIAPVKTAFNAAQWMCGVALGAMVFHAIAPGTAPTTGTLAALVAALATIATINAAAVMVVIHLDTREDLRGLASGLLPTILLGWGVNSSVGLLLVFSGQREPLALLLFLVPLFVLHRGSAGWAAAAADRARLEGMNRAITALAEELDPRDALPGFLAEVRRCFEASAAELLLIDGGGRVVYRVERDHPGEVGRRIETADVRSLGSVLLARGTAVRVTRPCPEPVLDELLVREEAGTCLGAPLISEGQTQGVLCVYGPSGPAGFEHGELAVLQALAGEAAATVRKVHLLQVILEERRKLSDIVNLTSDGIMTMNADGTILTWNPGIAEITRHGQAEMIGKRHISMLRPRDADGRDVLLDRWAVQDDPPAQLQIIDKGGETRWLSCTYTRVLDGDGAPSLLIVLARDVTTMHEIETLKEDFVATVSHELRTPLTPIRGWATMLTERADELGPDERRIAAESIQRQAEHLERLITNLLQVSQIERGLDVERDALVDAAEIVTKLVQEARAEHPDRRIDLAVAPAVARGNDLWIERILSNLLANALKYAPPHEPIQVRLHRDGTDVVVTVADHGPGISPRDIDAIFERFRRLGDHTTRATGGTGLGLYIARQLARSIGGTVTVESEVGHGSTFALRLVGAERVASADAPVLDLSATDGVAGRNTQEVDLADADGDAGRALRTTGAPDETPRPSVAGSGPRRALHRSRGARPPASGSHPR